MRTVILIGLYEIGDAIRKHGDRNHKEPNPGFLGVVLGVSIIMDVVEFFSN